MARRERPKREPRWWIIALVSLGFFQAGITGLHNAFGSLAVMRDFRATAMATSAQVIAHRRSSPSLHAITIPVFRYSTLDGLTVEGEAWTGTDRLPAVGEQVTLLMDLASPRRFALPDAVSDESRRPMFFIAAAFFLAGIYIPLWTFWRWRRTSSSAG